jgi:hypothetical protein
MRVLVVDLRREPHNLGRGLGRIRLSGRLRMPRQGRQRIGEPMELGHLPYRDATFK